MHIQGGNISKTCLWGDPSSMFQPPTHSARPECPTYVASYAKVNLHCNVQVNHKTSLLILKMYKSVHHCQLSHATIFLSVAQYNKGFEKTWVHFLQSEFKHLKSLTFPSLLTLLFLSFSSLFHACLYTFFIVNVFEEGTEN